MAKIDEAINDVLKELQEKEITLMDMDDKIQSMLQTKDSVFLQIKDWVINTSNGILITYNVRVKSQHLVYITFKVIERRTDQLVRDMSVKIIKIIRR